MFELSVIVLLYNEFDLVITALSSIYKQDLKSMEVILIDNSTDKEGHKKVLKQFPQIKYFQNKKDLGFAGGMNVGFKKAKGKYILTFTPDMYLLQNTVKKSLSYIDSHPQIGIIANRVYASRGKQEPSAAKSYPNLLSQLFYYNMPLYKIIHRLNPEYNQIYFSMGKHREILYPKWVGGQSTMIRRAALEKIGYFDSRFFLYFEDVDFCRRLINNGWQVVYLPVGGVVQNGKSDWKTTQITQTMPPYMKSLYKLFIKYDGRVYSIFAWSIAVVSALISIPYFLIVIVVKNVFGKNTQAKILLPLWLGVVRWHFTDGIRVIFNL
jgi:GT2 family glycosyltransferase